VSAPEDSPDLRTRTSAAWARAALADPVALLEDHAHLEKKAAVNALDLLERWPDLRAVRGDPPAEAALVREWTRAMTRVARDEVEHLGQVLRELASRGGALRRPHRNPYAAGLRRLVRTGAGPDELVDRLLVSALIEARSCDRFRALAEACDDARLGRLYRALLASERGHRRRFLDFALAVPGARHALRRWHDLLDAESRLLATLPPGPAIHSGEPR
jgi:tRNA-(ms[2]io[6]A)-hydroxylase